MPNTTQSSAENAVMKEYLILVNQNEGEHRKATPAQAQQHIREEAELTRRLTGMGVYRDGERLRPASEGKRVRLSGGKPQVQSGPFDGEIAALNSYHVVQAMSLEEAVELGKGYPALPGDVVEVRPVMQGHMGDNKSDHTGKVFAFSVLGSAPNEEAWIRTMNRIDEETGDNFPANSFLGGVRLDAPRTGRRIVNQHGKPVVVDGPFLESKEVIGGIFFMRFGSIEDAIEWGRATPFVHLGTLEIREVWRS